MATRYWTAAGGGNWNDTANWSTTSGSGSGASVPVSGDTAILNGGSGGSSTVITLDISPTVAILTCTGFVGTLAFGSRTITLDGTGTIFTGATTMAVSGTPLIICTNSSATARTLTPTAVTEANSISFRITAGTGTLSVTTTGGPAVRDLDFTDGVNPTGYGGALQNLSLTIYGNFKASTNMTKVAGTSGFTFAATSGTKTINTAGVAFDNPFAFNGVGGTWQLQAALTSGSTRTCTLTNGTLDLNGYTLTTGLFNSSNANTRTLAFGTGNIVVNATSGTVLNINTTTGLTVSGTGRLVEANSGGAGTRTFAGGISLAESSAVNILVSGGSDIVSFSGTGNSFGNVSFVGFTGTLNIAQNTVIYGNWTFGSGMATPTVTSTGNITFSATSGTKTITSNGKVFAANNITFNGAGGSWQLQDAFTTAAATTLTAGTLDLNSKTLTTSTYAGTGSAVRSLLSYSVPIVVTGNSTTVISLGTTTNLSVDVHPTFQLDSSAAASGTTRSITWGASSNLPAVPNINVINGGDTVTTGGTTTLNNLTFSGTFTGILGNATRNIYGDLTLKTGMSTESGSLVNTFIGVSSQTITTSGLTLDFPITFNGIGGTWSMQDALTMGSTQALTMSNGTLKLKSSTTNTVGSFFTSGATQKYLQSTIAGTQATISQASGTVNVSYLTIQDSNATGGAVFQAFTSNANVNSGNNKGWYFLNSVNFLPFF